MNGLSNFLEYLTCSLTSFLFGKGRVSFFILLILFAQIGPAIAAEPGLNKKFKRSRLTYDETESLADRRKLLLSTGEDRAVDLDFDANADSGGIAIGNPTVVSINFVKVGDKRQIVFKPLKAGDTSVTVRDQAGNLKLVFQVHVVGTNLLRLAGELRSLIGDVEGINIRIVGGKIVVEGEVLVVNDYGKVFAVVSDKAYAEVVMNLVSLSPLALQVIAKKVEDDVKPLFPNVKIRVVNGTIFIEGEVASQAESDKVTRMATLYLPESRPPTLADRDGNLQKPQGQPRSLIQNFLVIKEPPKKKDVKLIRVTVHFVELSKDYLKVFGFKWQPGFTSDPQIQVGQGSAGSTAANTVSFSATISSLVPRLESLQRSGYARVLKTGTVIVKSGEPATIKEVTQIPVSAPVQTQQAQAPQPVGVGITVKVTPQQLGKSDDISMQLSLEASNLVGKSPAGSTPMTASHQVETQLFVKTGKSAAVAGMNSADIGTDFNKDDPKSGSFEGSTTPLFTLMRTKNYRKKKSQFVVFVTPELIDDASEGNEDLKRNFRVQVR